MLRADYRYYFTHDYSKMAFDVDSCVKSSCIKTSVFCIGVERTPYLRYKIKIPPV